MIDFGYMELDEYTKSLDKEIEDRKQLNLYNKTLKERVQSLQDSKTGGFYLAPFHRFFQIREIFLKKRTEKLTK